MMPAPKQVSPRQMELLLQFIEDNRALALGQLVNSGPLAKHETSERWEALASSLNSLGEGVTKTGAKWRNYWNNLKYSVRHKAAECRGHAMRTGGGPPKKEGLTLLDERVLSVIGKVSVHGNESVRIAFNPLPATPALEPVQQPLLATPSLETQPLPSDEDDYFPPVFFPQTATPHVSRAVARNDENCPPAIVVPRTATPHVSRAVARNCSPVIVVPRPATPQVSRAVARTLAPHLSQEPLPSDEDDDNFPPVFLPHTATPHVSRAVARNCPPAIVVPRTATPHVSRAVARNCPPAIVVPRTATPHVSRAVARNCPPAIVVPRTATPHVSRAVARNCPPAIVVPRTATPHVSRAVARNCSPVIVVPRPATPQVSRAVARTLAPHLSQEPLPSDEDDDNFPPVFLPHTAMPHVSRTVARMPTLAPHVANNPETPASVEAAVATSAPSLPAPSQQPSRRRRTVQPDVPQWALAIEERRLKAQEDMAASMRQILQTMNVVAADVAAIRSRLEE